MERKAVKECGLSKKQVFTLAERVATKLGYEPGGELLPMLEKLGGTLEYRDFWSSDGEKDPRSGSIEIDGLRNFRVYIATDTSPARDRFTIAHEIGHYVLHYFLQLQPDEPEPRAWASRYGRERAEWEANWFAAAFLMPSAQFLEALDRHEQDVDAVAREFGVSMLAAKLRAQELGRPRQ